MTSLKSPLLAILGLSLVFSTLPFTPKAEAAHAKHAVGIHVDMVIADDSCDAPAERAVFTGPLVDPSNVFVADPDDDDDDEDQGDEVGSAPVAVNSSRPHRYDPPASVNVPFFDVVVRGRKTLLAVFSRAGPASDSDPEAEPHRASLPLQASRTGRPPVALNPPTADDRPSRSFLPPLADGLAVLADAPDSR